MPDLRSIPMTGSAADAAERLVSKVQQLSTELPYVILGWPGGRSPKSLIEQFVVRFSELPGQVRDRIVFAQIDERLRRNDTREHNITVLDELLFGPLTAAGAVRSERILRYPLDAKSDAEGIAAYTNELARYGGRFHVVVLGAGEDGHIAGCFPEHPTGTSQARELMAYEEAPKPPQGRMTATLPLLAEASFGVVLFLGEGKREAFTRFLSPDVGVTSCPAKVVLQMAEAIVLTDLPIPDRVSLATSTGR